MSTVELEASLDELPEAWRAGRALHDGDVLVVRVRARAADNTDLVAQRKRDLAATAGENFWDVADRVAGVWANRSDEEIEAWQRDMRAARKERFDTLFADDK